MVGIGIAGCDGCGCEPQTCEPPCQCVPSEILWEHQYDPSSTVACYDCAACPNPPPFGSTFDISITAGASFTIEEIQAIYGDCTPTLETSGRQFGGDQWLFDFDCITEYYYGEAETECYTCRKWPTPGPGCDDLTGLPAFIAAKRKSIFYGTLGYDGILDPVIDSCVLRLIRFDLYYHGEGSSAEAACEDLCLVRITSSAYQVGLTQVDVDNCCSEVNLVGVDKLYSNPLNTLYGYEVWQCDPCYSDLPGVLHIGCTFSPSGTSNVGGFTFYSVELVC